MTADERRRLEMYDAAIDMGAQLGTIRFLEWIADRIVNQYRENPNSDFVLSLRARTEALRKAREA